LRSDALAWQTGQFHPSLLHQTDAVNALRLGAVVPDPHLIGGGVAHAGALISAYTLADEVVGKGRKAIDKGGLGKGAAHGARSGWIGGIENIAVALSFAGPDCTNGLGLKSIADAIEIAVHGPLDQHGQNAARVGVWDRERDLYDVAATGEVHRSVVNQSKLRRWDPAGAQVGQSGAAQPDPDGLVAQIAHKAVVEFQGRDRAILKAQVSVIKETLKQRIAIKHIHRNGGQIGPGAYRHLFGTQPHTQQSRQHQQEQRHLSLHGHLPGQ